MKLPVWLKSALRRSVGSLGYEIHKKGRRNTLSGFLAHIRGLGYRPSTVIDVGAAYGTDPLYQTFPEAKHLLIEPLLEFEPYLERIVRRYQASVFMGCAGAAPGRATLTVDSADLTGATTLSGPGTEREVDVSTLNSLIRERHLSGPYLIKLDVQGVELDVLRGAEEILPETDIIVLETSLFHFEPNMQNEFYTVLEFMKARGFVVYDIFGGNVRPLDAALGQVDLAFVHESGHFRRSHDWE